MLQGFKKMKKLWLSEKMVSRAFWQELRSSVLVDQAKSDADEICSITAPVVDDFLSIAGSIGKESSILLWLLTKYFSPRVVAEVGTYIGRSTLSIACGGKDSIERLFTCDGTFDCLDLRKLALSLKGLSSNLKENLTYFGKTMSHVMFQKIIQDSLKVDMLFIDGRLAQEDLGMLSSLMAEDCIIVLDDFEGVEKGLLMQ